MLDASARAAFDNSNYESAVGNLVKLWRILCFPIGSQVENSGPLP
jgi:hypothetical protein